MGATAVTMLLMETTGQRGLPQTQQTRGQRARSLEHKENCAWPIAVDSNANAFTGAAFAFLSSNGAARTGTGHGSMRSTKFQGTVEYVTRISRGVGVRGREASSYPD